MTNPPSGVPGSPADLPIGDRATFALERIMHDTTAIRRELVGDTRPRAAVLPWLIVLMLLVVLWLDSDSEPRPPAGVRRARRDETL